MDFSKAVKETVSFLTQEIGKKPDVCVILGSGLGDFAMSLSHRVEIPYETIPYFDSGNIEGHSGSLVVGELFGKTVFALKGRRHYYQGYSDEEMRFPIAVMSKLGAKRLIVTNACGGMNPKFSPGDIMVITDHINMMGRNPLIGHHSAEFGERFVDMTEPYDPEWIKQLETIAKKEDISIQTGIYVGYSGPSYETKSEIAAYRMLGGDAVGMSTVPEVIVARQAGMRVLGISCITNMSTGMSKGKLSHEEVLEVSSKSMKKISILLSRFIESLD